MNLIKQKGIGLIEVMVAFIIIATSAVALVGLQNRFMQTEDESTSREVAMHLAETALDELRTFDSINTTTGIVAYEDIASNSLGTSQSIGKFTYTTTWTVTNRFFTTPTPTLPDQKDVNVVVTWHDQEGTARSISLFGIISPNTSLNASSGLASGSAAAGLKPKVIYTPGVAPDVISVALGNGSKQETTKPLPQVSNSGGSIQVQFDTVTYNQASNTQVLADTLTLSCSCTFGSGTQNTALPAEPTLFDGLLYWKAPKTTAYVAKKWGASANNQQSAFCDVCCLHHNDRYDTTSGLFGDYYNRLNYPTSKYNSSMSAVTSGNYIDSCRLLRIDGYYKPMPDWNMVKLVVMSTDFLKKTANQTSYQNYINYVVQSYVSLQKAGTWPSQNSTLTSDSTANSIQNFSTWLANHAATGGDTTTTVVIDKNAVTPVSKQLIARGIFVDVMSDTWLNTLNVNDSDFLAKVPFYDINMTLLSQWSSSNTTVATVYSEPIKTLSNANSDYYGVYKRGYILDDKTGSTAISVKAFQGNSSVAAYQNSKNTPEVAISTYDNTKALTDYLTVTVGGTVPPTAVTVSGSLYCLDQTSTTTTTGTGQNKIITTTYSAVACATNGNNKTFDNLTIASSNNAVATCTLSAVNATASPAYRPFSCTTTKGASFNITVGGTATGYVTFPSPKVVTLDANSTATSVQIGCINVYQTTLATNPGLNFDSSGCVTH
jgi:Tfp pilus assembly protein PilV